MYILNKITVITENRSTVLLNLFFFYSMKAIKNDPFKKATSFFAFMEDVQLSHGQALAPEDRNVYSRLYQFSVDFIVTTHFSKL